MTLDSKTGAVGAYLPSLLSMVPNLWSSKTPEKQSEKSERVDSSALLSNGRKVSQQLTAEPSAVTTLAKTFTLSPENQTIVEKLAKKTYKKFEKLNPEIAIKEEAPGGFSSYMPSAEKMGGVAGYTTGYMYAEAGILAVASKVSTAIFGPGIIAGLNAKLVTATAVSYGAVPAIAAAATVVGAAAFPAAKRGLDALIDRARGSQPEKPVAKKLENISENSPLSKVITVKDGAYFIGSRELKTDSAINTLLKRDTFYQICQQILNSDQAEDLFKTYVRERSDSKKVLADGYVCTPEEAELLTKAENLLRDDNMTEESAEIASAIELLAEHHKPAKDSKIFSERYKPSSEEAYRKSITNDLMMVEMSDGTFGFEDDQGVISLISNEMAAAIRAGNDEYVHHAEQQAVNGMKEFVVMGGSEETKKEPETFLASAFNRLAPVWLKA